MDLASGERDEFMALAIAAGHTYKEAAQVGGCTEDAVKTKMAKFPEFRRLVDQKRADLLAEVHGRLLRAMTKAVRALEASLESPDERNRIVAAKTIMDYALKTREIVSLEPRLKAIEDRLVIRASANGARTLPSLS